MIKYNIWSILPYGMETWTLKEKSMNKLEIYEYYEYSMKTHND